MQPNAVMHGPSFLKAVSLSMPAAGAVSHLSAFGTGKKQPVVRIVQFDAARIRTGVVEVEKVAKSEAEWKQQLTPQQFEVTRQAGTQHPGTGKYANNQTDGLYHCIWPSFWQPTAKENVRVSICRRRRSNTAGVGCV